MAKNKELSLHKVEKRLIALRATKEKYSLVSKADDWKRKANAQEVNWILDENDFRTQVSSVVKRQKDAELLASIPEYDFIPLSEDWERNRKIVKEAFDFHWIYNNIDKIIAQIVSQSTTYWTWILEIWLDHIIREENKPRFNHSTKMIEFDKKEVVEHKIYAKKIPFNNFYINWTDIDESTEAIAVAYYAKDSYMKAIELNPMYSNLDKVQNSYKFYHSIWEADGEDITSYEDTDESTIVELRYWNIATDEYIILANWIEIYKSHIPYEHKKLPFALFIDNLAEDRIYWIWEFELLEEDERVKNEYRTLTIKWIKANIWFLLKDKNSDLEASDVEFWIWEVYETDDIDSFQHFAPNINIQAISDMELKIDNDIIAKSWIDFKSIQLSPGETATKTANKVNSSKKRINKNLKDNAYWFYRRLWFLLLSSIQQLHELENQRIPIKGWSITDKWVFIKDETWSYWSWIIWANFIKWKFEVIPITETMLWNSSQRKKENLWLFAQFAWNIAWDDWRPVIKGKQLVQLACTEYGYDFEKLTEEVNDSLSADDMINKVFSGWTNPADNPNNPNYVPPEQRSQKDQVKALSGQAKIRPDEWLED